MMFECEVQMSISFIQREMRPLTSKRMATVSVSERCVGGLLPL